MRPRADVRYYKSPTGEKITYRVEGAEPPKGYIEVSTGEYQVHKKRLKGEPITMAEVERLVPESTPEEKRRIYEEVYKPQKERIKEELERQRKVLRRKGIVGTVPVTAAFYERAKEVLSAEEMAEIELERGLPYMIAKLTPPPEYAKRPIPLEYYRERVIEPEITPEELVRKVAEERRAEVKPFIEPWIEDGQLRKIEVPDLLRWEEKVKESKVAQFLREEGIGLRKPTVPEYIPEYEKPFFEVIKGKPMFRLEQILPKLKEIAEEKKGVVSVIPYVPALATVGYLATRVVIGAVKAPLTTLVAK